MTDRRKQTDPRGTGVPDSRRHGWRRFIRENAYRDLWLLGITAVVVIALVRQGDTLDKVQQGRRQTIAINCGATAAVIDAGRTLIKGSAAKPFPPQLERFLHSLGYPPRPVRQKQAKAAADAYAAAISSRIAATSGVHGLIRRDGSLDCRRIQRIARTAP
jgi:hypothetical protein